MFPFDDVIVQCKTGITIVYFYRVRNNHIVNNLSPFPNQCRCKCEQDVACRNINAIHYLDVGYGHLWIFVSCASYNDAHAWQQAWGLSQLFPLRQLKVKYVKHTFIHQRLPEVLIERICTCTWILNYRGPPRHRYQQYVRTKEFRKTSLSHPQQAGS